MEPTLNTSPVQNPMPEAPTPMAQSMPQQAPVMETPMATAAPVAAKKNSFGPLIGAAIIILILIAGALYFWSPLLMPTGTTTSNMQPANADVIDAATQVSAATASVEALQDGGMEADLNTLSQ